MAWLLTREGRSAGLYLGASVLAGLLNYLFQVVASRQLSAQDFADLNGWFANVSILFVMGGVLQYAAVFVPTPVRVVRGVLVIACLMMGASLWYWISRSSGLGLEKAWMIVSMSIVMGWLSFASVLAAAMKLGMTWFPLGTAQEVDRYALALFAPFLLVLVVYAWRLWRARPVESHHVGRSAWIAPICLSLATAVVPQLDLVLMHHTQSPTVFAEFARVSLFYRVIYILAFVLAQWLLPRQVVHRSHRLWRALPTLVGLSLLLSTGLALASPWVVSGIFHWESTPDLWILWLACVHTSGLALLFFYIQEACAEKDWFGVALVLGLWAVEASVQMTIGFEVRTYLQTVIGLDLVMLVYLWRRGRGRGVSDTAQVR